MVRGDADITLYVKCLSECAMAIKCNMDINMNNICKYSVIIVNSMNANHIYYAFLGGKKG